MVKKINIPKEIFLGINFLFESFIRFL